MAGPCLRRQRVHSAASTAPAAEQWPWDPTIRPSLDREPPASPACLCTWRSGLSRLCTQGHHAITPGGRGRTTRCVLRGGTIVVPGIPRATGGRAPCVGERLGGYTNRHSGASVPVGVSRWGRQWWGYGGATGHWEGWRYSTGWRHPARGGARCVYVCVCVFQGSCLALH
jgi:hypothetical protein